MGYARVFSRAELGLVAPLVTVEVHLSGGLPQFQIVGLPETAVRESRERVRGALVNSKFEFPASRITVNLAPADLPKHGGRFDIAIALGILAASGQISDQRLSSLECLGELTLAGRLAAVAGVLPACIQTHHCRRELVVAHANAQEASLVDGLRVRPASSLVDVARFANNDLELSFARPEPCQSPDDDVLDLCDVRGQASAKRALVIAAAGSHNLLLTGPPGTGKSMLAARLPGLLPPMSVEERLECTAIASLCTNAEPQGVQAQRPFRSPHHSASAVSLIGGGTRPRPGEISRAHNGVLFLDELPEFSRHALEMLREPLETGVVHLSRASMTASYPARFQLVAAMNPCPCGFAGDAERQCRCSSEQLARYRNRVSGPLLDRMDLAVTVERIPFSLLTANEKATTSATLARVCAAARDIALKRQGMTNAQLPASVVFESISIEPSAQELLSAAASRWAMSARSCHRVMRVARTIADLADSQGVEKAHMAEALMLREAMTESASVVG